MASDSQNKIPKPDNVVSLNRHELVADVDEKLAEARRLYSLHDYRASEDLVQAVLRVDPQNSKAKALLELTSIKLSRRKLYKKMVDAAPVSSKAPAEAPANAAGSEGSGADVSASPAKTPPLSSSSVDSSPPKPPETAKASPPSRKRRPATPAPNPAAEVDTMRERTISALVELLKHKDKRIEDWKDPRFTDSSQPETAAEPESQQAFPSAALPEADSGTPLPNSSGAESARMAERETGVPSNLPDLSPQPEPALPAPTNPALFEPVPAPSASAAFDTAQNPPSQDVAPKQPPAGPSTQAQLEEASKPVIRLPDVRLFENITSPQPVGHKEAVQGIEQQSKEISSSEIKKVSIAQVKKYLYQEEYELCSLELERIRTLFPNSRDIQAFVSNTSLRLVELQRKKTFEEQAKDLMASAVAFYKEGKLGEALVAAQGILRVNPDHAQAKEFVGFVGRRQHKEKKELTAEAERFCTACSSKVDAASHFCPHCGTRLS
jgi:hypothetical protein